MSIVAFNFGNAIEVALGGAVINAGLSSSVAGLGGAVTTGFLPIVKA